MSRKNSSIQNDNKSQMQIIKSNCSLMEEEIEKKINKTKNLIRKTAISLQKITEPSKIELYQSSNIIESQQVPSQRKVSINIYSKIVKNKNSQLEINQNSQLISLKSIQGQSEKLIDSQTPVKEQDDSKQISSQNQSLTNDGLSSKCSILIDVKNYDKTKNNQSNNIECEQFIIDHQNDLEKRIHQWLDDQGIKMVNPSQNHQEYFDSKRSQILIMCKKLNFNKNCSSITQDQLSYKETLYLNGQSSEKLISSSCAQSPQKMNSSVVVQNKYDYKIQQKLNEIQFSQNKNAGSDIIIQTLFSNSINDSPLMQRRKGQMQRDQIRNNSCDNNTSEKKSNGNDNNRAKQILNLSKYKRFNPSKSNIESITDIMADCK